MCAPLRVLYMGTPEFAVAPLVTLIQNNYTIIAVVTAPDKPAGRGKKNTGIGGKKNCSIS